MIKGKKYDEAEMKENMNDIDICGLHCAPMPVDIGVRVELDPGVDEGGLRDPMKAPQRGLTLRPSIVA